MALHFILTSVDDSATVLTMGAGDTVLVGAGVYAIDNEMNGTATTPTINDTSWGAADIDGAVYGYIPLEFAGAVNEVTTIDIAASGSLIGLGGDGAIQIGSAGTYFIENSGQISNTPAIGSNDTPDGIYAQTSGEILNYGSIEGSYDGVENVASSGTVTLDNYGSISGGDDGVYDSGAHTAYVNNFGSIDGAVGVYADPSTREILTNAGSITGLVLLKGAGSSVKDTGTILGGIDLSASSGVQSVAIGKTGVVESKTNFAALYVYAAGFQIVNSGEILALGIASDLAANGVIVHNSGAIFNGGKIEATAYGIVDLAASGVTTITNTGSIWGNNGGIEDFTAGGVATSIIDNYGEIGAAAEDDAIYASSDDNATVVNAGTISGNVQLDGANSAIFNRGSIDGDVTLGGAGDYFINRGVVDGNISLDAANEDYWGGLGDQTGTITAAAGGDYLYAGAGDETFLLMAAGAAYVHGGTGDDVFDFGSKLTAATEVVGGAGADTVILDGNYTGATTLTLGADTLQGIGTLDLESGFSYDIVANPSMTLAAAMMTVDGSTLGPTNSLTFDASAASESAYDLIGGAGADTFIFTVASLDNTDTVVGGAGAAIDTLQFSTAGSLSDFAFAHVSGIERIVLANGTNNILLTNALVASANGHTLGVRGGTGADTIDASLVTAGQVVMTGFGGADTLIAGGGKDYFRYLAASDSTGPVYDTIEDANLSVDRFIIPTNSVGMINTPENRGSLSTATFNTDLAAAIGPGQLGPHDAVLFTASAGTLATDTFLIVNLTGTAGYQAGSDLVIQLTGQTGTLTTANFS